MTCGGVGRVVGTQAKSGFGVWVVKAPSVQQMTRQLPLVESYLAERADELIGGDSWIDGIFEKLNIIL